MRDVARWRKWTRLKKSALAFGVVLAAYAAFIGIRMYVMQPALIVSSETTFITKPLRPDGTPDYAAALHEEWSKGVTPENNAAVPLARAFGPAIIAPEMRERYFKLIGIEPPAEDGVYCLSLYNFAKEQRISDYRGWELEDARTDASIEKIKVEYPELLEWAKANVEPLKLISDASRRSRFYSPLVRESAAEAIFNSDSDALQRQCRDTVDLYRFRARLLLAEGAVEEACDDTIACYRLGRLMSVTPTMLGVHIALGIERAAIEMAEQLVNSGQLTAESARSVRKQLEASPPSPNLHRIVDRGERMVALDSGRYWIIDYTEDLQLSPLLSRWLPILTNPRLDPNIALKEANDAFDEALEAFATDVLKNVRSYEQIEKQEALLSENARQPDTVVIRSLLLGNRQTLTRQFCKPAIAALVPAVQKLRFREKLVTQSSQLLLWGLALAEHRALAGAYPERIEDLSPELIENYNVNDLWGRPLQYRRVGEGFLLYSIGPNGRDDGGRDLGDNKGDEERFDDIRFGVAPLLDRPEDDQEALSDHHLPRTRGVERI